MRGVAGVAGVAATIAAVLLASVGVARAGVAWSYEVESKVEGTAPILVVWPRVCSASGEPLGAVDLGLNPDWAARTHEVDYEVVVAGKRHVLLEHCAPSARLYALPADAFPRATRASTADDVDIGQPEAGVPFAIVPSLDGIDRARRIAFFAEDPRVMRSAFRFAALKADARAVVAVHAVLAVERFEAGAFGVGVKSVKYTYEDGGVESVAEAGAGAGGAEGGVAVGVAGSGSGSGSGSGGGGGGGGGVPWWAVAVVGVVGGGVGVGLRRRRARRAK